MSHTLATSLMIVFTAVSFITFGRAPRLVRPNTRDLEVQMSLTAADIEAG